MKKLKKIKHIKTPSKRVLCRELSDLEHKISMDVGDYLVLREEGTSLQAKKAFQKARVDLLKWGPEMQKIANQMGGNFPDAVADFIASVDALVHTALELLDQGTIKECYNQTQKLEKALRKIA